MMTENRMGDNVISELTNTKQNGFKVVKTNYPFRFAVIPKASGSPQYNDGKRQEFDIRKVVKDNEVFISVLQEDVTNNVNSKGEIIIGTARDYQADAFRYAQWFFSQEINKDAENCIYTRTLTKAQVENSGRIENNEVKITLVKIDDELTSNDALTSFIFEREKEDSYICVISTDKSKVEPWTTFRLWYGYMSRIWEGLPQWDTITDPAEKKKWKDIYDAKQQDKKGKSSVVEIGANSVTVEKSIVKTPTHKIEIVLDKPVAPTSGGKRRTRKNRSKLRFTS